MTHAVKLKPRSKGSTTFNQAVARHANPPPLPTLKDVAFPRAGLDRFNRHCPDVIRNTAGERLLRDVPIPAKIPDHDRK